MSATGITYLLAVCFWAFTALYGVVSLQAFVQEHFLQPRLFSPVAAFSDWHTALGLLTLAAWSGPRWRAFLRQRSARTWTAGIAWVGATTLLAFRIPLSPALAPAEALAVIGTSVLLILILALAQCRPIHETAGRSSADRSLADLTACLLAALAATLAHLVAAAWVDASQAIATSAAGTLRLHLLLGVGAFLVLSGARALAALTPRPMASEAVLSVTLLAGALGGFITMVVLASLSIRGPLAIVLGLGLGTALACAAGAQGTRTESAGDGVVGVFSALSPRMVTRWWGLALWLACLAIFASAMATANRTVDWNFVLLRTGVVLSWLLALSATLAFSRRVPDGGAVRTFALAALLLAAHIGLDRSVAPVQASSLKDASGQWIFQMRARTVRTKGTGGIVELLHANTNIPRATPVAAVDVDLAALSGSPSAVRPHVFVLVIDSLRRDYLAPYNPAVTFTPGIAAFAEDSLVFRNAFTQYGATGLSVPSIWVGAPILHKQYVSSFPRMNTLAKLLAHEQYEQWLSVDHIVDTITPAAARSAPLNAGVLVKNFRTCSTLTEIRSRLARRQPTDAPIFAYALPQDVHVSVVTSEGAQPVDGGDYRGFYAPVASRIHRLDECVGDFIADLKARGLYDHSIIVLTSDHGDSLGEEGRMGHAYSMHPEVVRIPLIVRVPPAMRSAWTWNETRVAYSTDITPTLYRLLGHEPSRPAAFFGEPLAQPLGRQLPPQRERMLAASYGAVYGALLASGTRYYVFDAVAMREMAFEMRDGAEPGKEVPVTPDVRDRGLDVIRSSVGAISTFYRFSTTRDSAP
jgi:arylsulfatase A-like enzyme